VQLDLRVAVFKAAEREKSEAQFFSTSYVCRDIVVTPLSLSFDRDEFFQALFRSLFQKNNSAVLQLLSPAKNAANQAHVALPTHRIRNGFWY
jgi:hypothetical protein